MEEKTKEKTKVKAKKPLSAVIKDTLNDYKGEFRKIMWPSKKDLIKQTATVIFMSLLVGAIITIMDLGFGYGQQFFAALVG